MTDLAHWPITEQLSSERLVLEPLRVDHASEVAAALDDAALHTFTGGHPVAAEQLAARYARQVVGHSHDGTQRWCNWVLRQRCTERVTGYVQATIEDDNDVAVDRDPAPARGDGGLVAELAWVVAPPNQGHGLAKEAVSAMVTWLRACGVDQVVAHVHPEHTASAAVARAAGMLATGVVVDGEVCWRGEVRAT